MVLSQVIQERYLSFSFPFLFFWWLYYYTELRPRCLEMYVDCCFQFCCNMYSLCWMFVSWLNCTYEFWALCEWNRGRCTQLLALCQGNREIHTIHKAVHLCVELCKFTAIIYLISNETAIKICSRTHRKYNSYLFFFFFLGFFFLWLVVSFLGFYLLWRQNFLW